MKIRMPVAPEGLARVQDARRVIWNKPDPSMDMWVAEPCQRCNTLVDKRALPFGTLLLTYGPLDDLVE